MGSACSLLPVSHFHPGQANSTVNSGIVSFDCPHGAQNPKLAEPEKTQKGHLRWPYTLLSGCVADMACVEPEGNPYTTRRRSLSMFMLLNWLPSVEDISRKWERVANRESDQHLEILSV